MPTPFDQLLGALPNLPITMEGHTPSPAMFGWMQAVVNALLAQGGSIVSVPILASEAIPSGAVVNVWDDGGCAVRNADGGAYDMTADGFVVQGVSTGDTASVLFIGLVTGASGLTPGPVYLGDAPGTVSSTPLTGSGQTSQRVGTCVDDGGSTWWFNPWPGLKLR